MRWLLLLCVACTSTPKGLGIPCSRTSQCDTPLVCRLQACRNECATSRDCPRGSVCLVDDQGFGACRLSDEAACGDCPAPAICFGGECRNRCTANCPEGECLQEDGEACEREPCACVEVERNACTRDADCDGLVCLDGVCRAECLSSRDCSFGTRCVAGRCTPLDGGFDASADPDVGVPDAGPGGLSGSSISAAEHHTCAVNEGAVWCWGNFAWEVPPSILRHYPPRPFGADATRVVAGPSARHFCAIADGALLCAGANLFGAVGDGTNANRETLVPVTTLDADVEDVAVGVNHSCAVRSGRVWCWGSTASGALGDGRSSGSATTPIELDLTDVRDVAAGDGQSCAVREDGTLHCWGLNRRGRAALGALPEALTPTEVPLSVRATRVSLGGAQGCIVADDESVHCWGEQVGPGVTDLDRPTPMAGVRAVDVAVGLQHICVVTPAREARCWGIGINGELGTGATPTRVDAPGEVVALPGVDEITAGNAHTCARAGSDLYCWGFNNRGQLGAGHRATTHVPVLVRSP